MNFTQRDHAIVLCYWDVLSASINVLDNHSAFVFWEFWPPDSLTMWSIIGFWSCCITSASRKDWRLSQPFGQCEIGPKKKMLTQENNAGYQGSDELSWLAINALLVAPWGECNWQGGVWTPLELGHVPLSLAHLMCVTAFSELCEFLQQIFQTWRWSRGSPESAIVEVRTAFCESCSL